MTFDQEVARWKRTHTWGGFVWPPERKQRSDKIRPVGMTLARAVEIAIAAGRRTDE